MLIRNCFVALFLLLQIIACKQPPERSAVAHPVHLDPFMARRLEQSLVQQRAEKDKYFLTDSESPLPAEIRVAFKGLEYYPINWKYRFEGPVNRYPHQEKMKMITTSGETREAVKYGFIRFYLEGKEFRLHVYKLLDTGQDDSLFVPFIDANVGKETYPAGRYIDLQEKADGIYVIDFNTAYNPSCAYGNNYPCPVTPEENRITLPVLAGEKILPLTHKEKEA